MAMGKRKPRQESLFVPTDQLAQAPGHLQTNFFVLDHTGTGDEN